MKIKSFEDFLAEIHAQDCTVCDDDMYDDFINWVHELDADDIFNYGNMYGNDLALWAVGARKKS